MPKILHITKIIEGGAGWAAEDICNSIPDADPNFTLIKKMVSQSTPDIRMLSKEPVTREDVLLKRFGQMKDTVFTSSNRTTEHISLGNPFQYLSIEEDVDIVHLHEVSDFIHFPGTFENIKHNVPIVWTLHDMNTISGGCHYFHGCSKYKAECSNCPQLESLKSIDLIKYFFDLKVNFFKTHEVHLVATSSYNQALAESSYLGKLCRSIFKIPYGIDENRFTAIPSYEKEPFRKLMKLDTSKLILGVGAYGLHRDIKGVHDFIEIIKKTKYRGNVFILFFGMGGIAHLDLDGLDYHYFGNISSMALRNIVYSIFDFFVFYSKEENFGVTITESLQCGTPVLGRKTGCIEDVIKHKMNGYILENSSIEEMNDAIEFCIENKNSFDSLKIREDIITEFSNRKTGEDYMNFYKKILT
jgi:glycosyltransferase involved in cell wall biosynthesis